MKQKLLKFGVPFLIGAVIALAVAWGQGLGGTGSAWSLRALSDGCFVTTILMGGMGVMMWVSTTGFFDIFSYAGKSLLVLFSPLKQPEKLKKFYEYKADKDEKRKKADYTLLIVGAAYLLLSFAFLGGYYAMMGA